MRDSYSASERDWVEQWARHYHDVVRYAAFLLDGDLHSAEDVAQEAGIRLWRHPDVVADGTFLTGWLRTVTRNIVIDRARRRRVRPAEVTISPGFDRASSDEFEDVDATAAVSSLLSGLSPQHQAVVLEVYVHDRPVLEVAAHLGVPSGTVKSRCHTALRHLRATTHGS